MLVLQNDTVESRPFWDPLTSRSRDVNKHGGGVNDLLTYYVSNDGGPPCLRWTRDVNKYGGWPNFGRRCGA